MRDARFYILLGEVLIENAASADVRPVLVEDEVFATGRLTENGQYSRFDAAGRGHYGEFIQNAGGLSVDTDLSANLASDAMVTIRGVWTGKSIRRAVVVDFMDPVEMPEGLGKKIDLKIVPVGRSTKDEILASVVLDTTKRISDDELLFYCAHQMPDGWIGVACASDSVRVEQALRPLLGSALVVVEVDWTTHDLQKIDESFTGQTFEDGLVSFGRFMNPAGQFKAYALVRMITPEMASNLSSINPNALSLTSWIRKL